MRLVLSNATRWRARLLLVLLFASFLISHPVLTQPQSPPTVFELELPDFEISPTSHKEITIPSASLTQVFIHVLNPVAENIDYSAIRTSVNGQAAAVVSEIVSGLRGKIVKINLKLLRGYEFVNGRNIVEIWAENRRGRMYYASFVIKTATENWNDDFTYQVDLSSERKNTVPPQIVLIEPERAITLPAASTTETIKINGVAIAATAIKRVSVNGKPVPLTRTDLAVRQLTRITNAERSISFETFTTINSNMPNLIVEAEDDQGSRTRVLVPVRRQGSGEDVKRSRRKFALIIGISKYQNNFKGIPNLEYADADARAVYEFLQQPAAGGFSREDMLLLANQEATLAGIRDSLTKFIGRASADDLLLIFLAGHGAPDPSAPQNLYVITHDTDINDMAHTALPMAELRRDLEQHVRSRRVVLLLDTCHSGGLSTDVTRGLDNNLANLYLEKLLYQEQGRAVITSSDVNEPSHESERWGNGHGVFTYYLLKGLSGVADVNHDRLVSVGELFRYVRQRVRLDTNFQQNPRMVIGENEDLALSVAQSRLPQ